MTLLACTVLGAASVAHAQTFEIVRELGTPQHYYTDIPFLLTAAGDAVPFPAAPDVQFALSNYATVRLRLVAPEGKKYVATDPMSFGWPGDINLVPVGSVNSGTLQLSPASVSFTTLSGTAPVPTVEGYRTTADWLKIRANGSTSASAGFEFTEVVLQWDVSAISGTSHAYRISDGGGTFAGPEITFYTALELGAPDPGPMLFLADITATAAEPVAPRTVQLLPNVPNPFNPSTTIQYELPVAGPVRIEVLDARGRRVRSLVSGWNEAGRHSVVWQGTDEQGRAVASGVYYYRLSSHAGVEARRMVLTK